MRNLQPMQPLYQVAGESQRICECKKRHRRGKHVADSYGDVESPRITRRSKQHHQFITGWLNVACKHRLQSLSARIRRQRQAGGRHQTQSGGDRRSRMPCGSTASTATSGGMSVTSPDPMERGHNVENHPVGGQDRIRIYQKLSGPDLFTRAGPDGLSDALGGVRTRARAQIER